jgi:hypothetical protein
VDEAQFPGEKQIDYFMTDRRGAARMRAARILHCTRLDDMFGSDHYPVRCTYPTAGVVDGDRAPAAGAAAAVAANGKAH